MKWAGVVGGHDRHWWVRTQVELGTVADGRDESSVDGVY